MFNDRNIVLFLSLNLGVFSARRILWQRSVFFPYAWFQSHNQYVPPDYEISPPDSPRLAGGAAEAAWLAVWFLPSSGGLQKLSEVNFPWSFTAPVKPSFRKSSFFWTTAQNAAAEMVYVTGWITTCWKKKQHRLQPVETWTVWSAGSVSVRYIYCSSAAFMFMFY